MSTHVFTNNSPPVQTLFMLQNTKMFFSHLIPSNQCCSLVCILKQHSSSMRWIVEALWNISSCKGLPNCSFAWQRFHILFFFLLFLLCHMQEYALENVSTSRRVISYMWTYIYTETAKYICRDCTRSMIEQKVNKRFRDKIGAIQFPWTALQ